jgi:hypothetical protein
MKIIWSDDLDHSRPKDLDAYKAEVRRFWIISTIFLVVFAPIFYLLEKPVAHVWWWLICFIADSLFYGGWVSHPDTKRKTNPVAARNFNR